MTFNFGISCFLKKINILFCKNAPIILTFELNHIIISLYTYYLIWSDIMNCINQHLWESIFGTVWEKFLNSSPDIGAFLLCHENKGVICEKNALKLANFNRTPSYDEFLLALTSLDELKTSINIIIVEDNEKYKAGFIRLMNEPNYGLSTELPLCSQAYIISQMTQSTVPSLLALLQLEEYGNPNMAIDAISEAVFAIKAASPENALISAVTRNKFWLYIPDFNSDKIAFLEDLQGTVKTCLEKSSDSSLNRRNITFTAGCGDERQKPSKRMHTAEFTLFDAISKGIGSICLYSDEHYEQQKNEYDKMRRFTKLVDNNLFTYHFQPIVSARTGDIVAYEALMRTDKSIDMYPLEILNIASKLERTYDIEKATMKNVLQYVSENQELFKSRKLFVNSIPAYMLSCEDWDSLVQNYGELMEKLVIEMTEQTELDNDKLAIIHDRFNRSNIPLAIDDYGTGYSNTTNLLRYNPAYVKIDRSLIDGINNKPKIEKLVSGIIEFIHANGFAALAEGVETSDELKTMIRLGADLIQGYYISKPKPFVLSEITPALCSEIVEYNRIYASEIIRVYHPAEGEVVDIRRLEEELYSSVFIEHDNVVLTGHKDVRVKITVQIKDGLKTKLTLKNCSMVSEKDDTPTIELGNDTEAEIWLEGYNECISTGIHVPQTSFLRIMGSGSLYLLSENVDCYGIGDDSEHSCGNISFEGSGRINIEANGDTCVAIGGGRNDNNATIRMLSGEFKINCSGTNAMGIGIFEGNNKIDISNCSFDIGISAANIICIGSRQGMTDICLERYSVNAVLAGHSICGIGTTDNGEGEISLDDGALDIVANGQTSNCIGSRSGSTNCCIKHSNIKLCCEGGTVSGIGNISGDGAVDISESSISINIHAKDFFPLAVNEEKLSIYKSAKNISINE